MWVPMVFTILQSVCIDLTCSFQVKDPVTGTLAPFNVLGESFAAAEPEWLKEGWLGFVGFYRWDILFMYEFYQMYVCLLIL